MERIISPQNSKVKLVNRLRTKRGRESERRFLVETDRELQRALDSDYEIEFVLFGLEMSSGIDEGLPAGVRRFEVPQALLKRLSYRENPSGFIAVIRGKTPKTLADLERLNPDSAVILDDLRKPGNIGALMRTASAAGIDAIVLVDSALDLYNPNVIRSSTGACFNQNIFRTSRQEALEYFRRRGFQLVAADADSARNLYDLDLRAKSAIILGAEDRGLHAFWREHCCQWAAVPMNGGPIDSLNVSVAGALFMYELRRQRLRP